MRFEDRLREKLKRAEVQMPLAKVDLQETMVSARRGLMLRYALSTLAIIVAIAGGAFAATDLFGNDVPTPGPAGSPSPDTAPSTSDSATENEADPSIAVQAVKAWIGALGDGDRERAWDLMTVQAKSSYDSYAAFESDTGLSEGWAAWAFAQDAQYYHHSLPSSEQATGVVIVTIAGTRQLEGAAERGASAMAVDIEGDRALVDPFVDGCGTTIDVTPLASVFEVGDAIGFETYVPERSMEIYFFISTQPAPPPPAETTPAKGPFVLAYQRPADRLPSGDYWVTITTTLADGSVWTCPADFEVE